MMMKRIYNSTLVLFAFLAVFSCKKNGIDATYRGETQLIIGGDYWANNSSLDSVTYSFAEQEVDVTVGEVLMNVSMAGQTSNQDREFKISVDPASTAQASEYELPATFIMPAGEVKTTFTVKVKRTPRLSNELATLILKVEPNEHFTPGLVTPVNTIIAANLLPIVVNYGPSFKIVWTDMFTKPANWDVTGPGIRSYVGEWSPAKHKFIVDVAGIRSFVSLSDPEKYALAALLYKELDEYNEANPNDPLLNLNGVPIQICPNCP